MKVFGIFLKNENGYEKLANETIVEWLKLHRGAFVMSGFPLSKYCGCFAFKNKFERDAMANELNYIGITFDTRDDGEIDDSWEFAFERTDCL